LNAKTTSNLSEAWKIYRLCYYYTTKSLKAKGCYSTVLKKVKQIALRNRDVKMKRTLTLEWKTLKVGEPCLKK